MIRNQNDFVPIDFVRTGHWGLGVGLFDALRLEGVGFLMHCGLRASGFCCGDLGRVPQANLTLGPWPVFFLFASLRVFWGG